MTSRERMLTALDNERPDRLPCQVHGWMGYYLRRYLDGMDWYPSVRLFRQTQLNDWTDVIQNMATQLDII